MLSICIPVHNQNIGTLMENLHQQEGFRAADMEILLFDDASDAGFRKQYNSLRAIPGVRFKQLDINVGRSRIRNLLCQTARHDLLLFLDGDSLLPDRHFLNRYLHVRTLAPVICGGVVYPPMPETPAQGLHWLVGSAREVRPARERNKQPHHSFMSGNFLAEKAILRRIPFNESISQYGHEDTLLGHELEKQQIPLLHIDNPVIHSGLETSGVFLKKTAQACENLIIICELLNRDQGFLEKSKVLRCCHWLSRWKLQGFVARLYRAFEKHIIRHLQGPSPRLWVLDLYKTGVICQAGNTR